MPHPDARRCCLFLLLLLLLLLQAGQLTCRRLVLRQQRSHRLGQQRGQAVQQRRVSSQQRHHRLKQLLRIAVLGVGPQLEPHSSELLLQHQRRQQSAARQWQRQQWQSGPQGSSSGPCRVPAVAGR